MNFYNSGKNTLGNLSDGMQLLADIGHEIKKTPLELIDGNVVVIKSNNSHFLPHIGWNSLDIVKPHKIFSNIKNNADYYFVHSFCFKARDIENIISYTDYGGKFASVINKNNVFGFREEALEKLAKKWLTTITKFY